MTVKQQLWRWKEAIAERVELAVDARWGTIPSPDRWVFIVGCTNSGTTLLHDILAQHPATGTLPVDGHFLQTQLPTPWDHGLERVWGTRPDIFSMTETSPSERRADRLKRQWGERYDDAHRPVLLEKTPTNALRMRWLERHFDNAHFVAIIRHPYAVVEGIRRKGGWPVDVGARQWAMTNERILEDSAAVGRFQTVRYEDLTERTDDVVDDLSDFIGLREGEIDTDRTWRTIGGWDRSIRNLNGRSLENLSTEDRRIIDETAGELMERLGYSAADVGA